VYEDSDSRPGLQRDLNEYLEIPLRRPFYVLVPTVVLTIAAVAYSFTVSKLYQSSTLIMVETQKVPASFVPDMASQSIADRMQTVKQEILSRTRLERVLEEVDPYPDAMGRRPLSSVIDNMRDDIKIVTKGRDAFTIEYVHQVPEMAQRVADRLATLFIQEVSQARSQQVSEASAFIASQVEEAALALEAKEKTLRDFKQRHMGTLPDQLNANLSTLQRLQLEHQAASESLRAARDRQVVVERNLADQVRATATVGGDPVTELPRLQNELASLRARYTDEHPDVQAMVAQIERMKRALADAPPQVAQNITDPAVLAARQQLDQVRLEVKALAEQKTNLESRMAQIQLRVDQVPAREQELLGLAREYEHLQRNYDQLIEKKLGAEMAAKLERRWQGDHFRMLDPATVPERPVYPNKMLFLLMGLVAGFCLGVGLAVLAELLDHSIKSLNELEALVPRPVLVSIPFVDTTPSRTIIGRMFRRG